MLFPPLLGQATRDGGVQHRGAIAGEVAFDAFQRGDARVEIGEEFFDAIDDAR